MEAAGLSEGDLAMLAEVDPSFVRRAVELGALQPDDRAGFRPEDATRLRFLKVWDSSGLRLEAVAEVVRTGDLSFSFLGTPMLAGPGRLRTTYEALCADRGVDVRLVQLLHDALGFAPPAPSDRVRDEDPVMLELLLGLLAAGASESTVLRLFRVYADGLRRLAQAEADLYESGPEKRMREAGATEQDLLDRGGAVGTRLAEAIQQTLLAIYRRHRQHVWLDHSVTHAEIILQDKGLYERLDRPPCVCFVDLAGYTHLTVERGDEVAAELAGGLAALVEGISRRHEGRPVRWLGDGGMFVFADAASSVDAAVEMVQQAPRNGLPPTHIGIHSGPVVFMDGDVYGTTVNIAARLSARATAGEVLVSREVAERAGPSHRFEGLGPVELKGSREPLEVFRAPLPRDGAA